MAAQTVWRGQFLEMYVVPTIDGGQWEYVKRTREVSAAVILAVDETGDLLLVEQYRPPLGRPCLELPAGLVGDIAGCEKADPLAAARRELAEETGYTARHWEYVGEFASSPGVVGEIFHFYRATGLTKETAGGGVDGEQITVHKVALADVPAFVAAARQRGCAIDTRLLLALQLV